MTSQEHIDIQHKISDFYLDLLSKEEKEVVGRHLADCQECRQALRRERQVGRLVHTTLTKVSQPLTPNLRAFMPAVPAKRPSLLTTVTPYRQWAMACLFIVAMMGAVFFSGSRSYGGMVRQATTHSATISSLDIAETSAPQTTRTVDSLSATAVLDSDPQINNYPQAVDHPPVAPEPRVPQATPAPAATFYQ